MTYLTELDLAHNHITSLPPQLKYFHNRSFTTVLLLLSVSTAAFAVLPVVHVYTYQESVHVYTYWESLTVLNTRI